MWSNGRETIFNLHTSIFISTTRGSILRDALCTRKELRVGETDENNPKKKNKPKWEEIRWRSKLGKLSGQHVPLTSINWHASAFILRPHEPWPVWCRTHTHPPLKRVTSRLKGSSPLSCVRDNLNEGSKNSKKLVWLTNGVPFFNTQNFYDLMVDRERLSL